MKDQGVTLASLGGLLTIISMTTFKNASWNIWLAAAAVVIVLIGVVRINKASALENEEEN